MLTTPAPQTEQLTAKERKDLKVLGLFTAVFCRANHCAAKGYLEGLDPQLQGLSLEKRPLCPECLDFLRYALERRLRCPLDPKPVCKHCRVHCYRTGHRERVREIMRFSGRRLILRGRLDLLWHYFF